MNKRNHLLIFSLALTIFQSIPGLAQEIIFNKVQLPGGNLGFIGGLAQDRNGYLWIASGKGLIRYDGYEYKTFLNDPANSNSLGQDHLEKVYADPHGIIWIATWTKGLDRFNPVTGKFTHFRHVPGDTSSLSSDMVRAILQDHEGTLWFGTHGGLDRFDPQTEKFIHYRNNPKDTLSLSCNRVRVLLEDSKGTLWIGTGSTWGETEGASQDEGGLNHFDRRTGKFKRYTYNPANPSSLINNKVQAILEDSKGILWVGTAGDGLHILDRETGLFRRYPFDPAHPQSLSRPRVNDSIFPDYITFINEDASGNIWIGTLGNGIGLYDRQKKASFHYQLGNGNSSEFPYSMYTTRDGIIWISEWHGKLFTVNPFYKRISYTNVGTWVSGISEGPSNTLWLGTGKGLIRKDKGTGISKSIVHDPRNSNSPSSNSIWSCFKDNTGILWLGTSAGLDRFDQQSNTFSHFGNIPTNSNSLDSGGVFAVAGAGRDSLWMIERNGIALMNTQSHLFTHYRYDGKDSNGLSSNNIRALQIDRDGRVWVGTFLKGLNCLDPHTGKCRYFLKDIPEIYKIYQDSEGTLWVATDAGIFIKRNIQADFVKFAESGGWIGLANISGMIEDNNKNLYICSIPRIYKIDLKNYQTVSFDVNGSGAQPRDYEFIIGSAYYGPDGTIYLGSMNGYFAFSPEKAKVNPVPPEIIFTALRVNGKPLMTTGKAPLDTPIQQAREITLNYDQNNIIIDFAGIHYGSPEQNQHLYTLQNFEEEWHTPFKEKTAVYNNLAPGEYIFRVKAANSDGVWAEKDLKITITPPWWKRWWAYALYISFLAAVIFLTDRIQRKRIIAKERERSRERELAQAKEIEKAYSKLKTTQSQLIQSEKMASLGELTAGIAHEIQNPLNFVTNFSEVNTELIDEAAQAIDADRKGEARDLLEVLRENEEKIKYHGQRADAIVKSMLQHSRVSTGQKELTDLNALADEYLRLSYHGMRAKEKNFQVNLETDYDPSVGQVNIIPQDIGRVLLNLFNNAFYAVAQASKQAEQGYKPSLWVSTKKLGDIAEIRVRDNGIGIPDKVKEKIFQPFFTTKPAGQGTGLGLSLSYDIIKAHGGVLKVETGEGEGFPGKQAGAEFIVQLPARVT